MEKVNKLASDPFQVFSIDDKDLNKEHYHHNVEAETLDKAITKISALLILGFGEAGSDIVT